MLGAKLASGMSLGQSLAVLTFVLTLVVIVLIGLDVPSRLSRLIDPEGTQDFLADVSERAEVPERQEAGEAPVGRGA